MARNRKTVGPGRSFERVRPVGFLVILEILIEGAVHFWQLYRIIAEMTTFTHLWQNGLNPA